MFFLPDSPHQKLALANSHFAIGRPELPEDHSRSAIPSARAPDPPDTLPVERQVRTPAPSAPQTLSAFAGFK